MTTKSDHRAAAALLRALERLLRPVARIALRYGLTYAAFDEVARRVFVEVTGKEFALPGRKLSDSRIAVLTGLTRREIAKIRKTDGPGEDDEDRLNRAARVIAGWRRDPEFRGAGGKPLALPFEDGAPSFHSLVRRYAGDVPTRATLDELLRVGAAERTRDGRIRLIARAYVPPAAEFDKLTILGSHGADLMRVLDHNLEAAPDEALFQRRVVYDNIPADRSARIRPVVGRAAQALLERLDRELAAHDRDASPDVEGEGRMRAALGIYYLEEPLDDDDE